MITVQALAKDYGGLPVLERVTIDVAEGTFCAIVGASGCGKSTFLRMLLGQEQPSRGRILLDGHPVPPEPSPDRGIVFQRYSVFPHLTVLQNLLLVTDFEASPLLARAFGARRRAARERAEAMLARVGLDRRAHLYPAQLSGGMQQRLAIAQALTKRPRVLLLDEPFGALDPGVRVEMHDLLLDIWREEGMTVFMVTHDIGEAFKLGTRLLAFDKVRHDPQHPEAYGATITYDLPINRSATEAVRAMAGSESPSESPQADKEFDHVQGA